VYFVSKLLLLLLLLLVLVLVLVLVHLARRALLRATFWRKAPQQLWHKAQRHI
jgi:uncharacterized protein YhhL (DUF1145 family)